VKCQDGSICCQVFPLDGRLKMLCDVVGPSFGAFDAVRVRGFAMFKDIKPSPYELLNGETSTWLDLVARILRMNGRGGIQYLKGSLPRLQAA
jgi:hypothetical protein